MKKKILPEDRGGDFFERAETVNQELILSDLDILDKRLSKIEKKTKSGEKEYVEEYNSLKKMYAHLNDGSFLSKVDLQDEEIKSKLFMF